MDASPTPRIPRWTTPLFATLGLIAMVAAMLLSVRYEPGLADAPRPCEQWATPCTREQVDRMLRRTEWMWLAGVALLLLSQLRAALAPAHDDAELDEAGLRTLRGRLLGLAVAGFPAYVVGVLATAVLGSLAPFTACALVLVGMMALALRIGGARPVSRRLLALFAMVAISLLAVPWMRNLGRLVTSSDGAWWQGAVGFASWFGALLMPVIGSAAALAVLHRGADPRA